MFFCHMLKIVNKSYFFIFNRGIVLYVFISNKFLNCLFRIFFVSSFVKCNCIFLFSSGIRWKIKSFTLVLQIQSHRDLKQSGHKIKKIEKRELNSITWFEKHVLGLFDRLLSSFWQIFQQF